MTGQFHENEFVHQPAMIYMDILYLFSPELQDYYDARAEFPQVIYNERIPLRVGDVRAKDLTEAKKKTWGIYPNLFSHGSRG